MITDEEFDCIDKVVEWVISESEQGDHFLLALTDNLGEPKYTRLLMREIRETLNDLDYLKLLLEEVKEVLSYKSGILYNLAEIIDENASDLY